MELDFSPNCRVQAVSDAEKASLNKLLLLLLPVGTGGFFRWGKTDDAWSWSLTSFSAKAKNEWSWRGAY
jgi:hypothetical protein